jgi:ABC-type phosphate transport system substrate-binding protein
MLCLFAYLLVMLSTTAADAQPNEPSFRVIVNQQNPVMALDRRFIADVFLKRKTRWPNGDVIRPVDLGSESPIRVRFSEYILERTLAQTRSYWQQRIFSGRELPPLEVKTEQDVIKFVLSYPTAIGYVSATTPIGEAKVIQVTNP